MREGACQVVCSHLIPDTLENDAMTTASPPPPRPRANTQAVSNVRAWLVERLKSDRLAVNVAGPREQKAPGIYEMTISFLSRVITKP